MSGSFKNSAVDAQNKRLLYIFERKVFIMIDLKRTFYTWSDTQPVAIGKTVSEEGQGLVAILEGGVEKVYPSEAAPGEKIVGFAMFRQKTFATSAFVEDKIIPTAAPFTVELSNTNLIVGQFRAYSFADMADFLVVPGPAPLAGQVVVDSVHGTLLFNVADAGKTVRMYYRWTMTVPQSILHYYEAPTNMPDPNFFAQVGVGKGKGRLFTMYFDMSVVWDGAVVPALGADGRIVDGGVGPAIPNARVVSIPTPVDPYLGIEFLI